MGKHTQIFRGLFLLLLVCVSSIQTLAQRIAIKSNVAELAVGAYNLEGEMVVGNRSTLCLGMTYGNKVMYKDVELFMIQPEYRYWFNGRPMIREFVGAGLLVTNYDMTWSDKHYKGTAIGGGMTFGYAFKLTKRLNIEATAGFGLVFYNHKMNYTTDNSGDVGDIYSDSKKITGYKILPTKLGITISYILK